MVTFTGSGGGDGGVSSCLETTTDFAGARAVSACGIGSSGS